MALLPFQHPMVQTFPLVADLPERLRLRRLRWIDLSVALVGAGVIEHAVPMLVAHLALEHGRDFDAVFNNSWGNVKLWRGAAPDTPFFVLRDGFKSTDRYQHHEDMAAGVRPFVREVKRRVTLYDAARKGYPKAYAVELLESEYIGDDPKLSYGAQLADVTACMRDLFREACGVLWPVPKP